MSRKARLIVSGAARHIMTRGIDGRNIFCYDEDRNFFYLYYGIGGSSVSRMPDEREEYIKKFNIKID